MEFGKRMIELRKKENITQEQLAKKLKVTRQTISNWESDITCPDINQALELAKVFEISLNDLLNEQVEIQCKKTNTILNTLVGKECCIDIDDEIEEYRIDSLTKCKILSIDENYVKFQFSYEKKPVTKLMDIGLIHSFKVVVEGEDK